MQFKIDTEEILCAAVWLDDGKYYPHQPTNIKSGRVYCGYRHCAIFQQIPTPKELNEQKIEKVEGFLTSENRFANRKAAAFIAFKVGQTKELKSQLTSEDLY